MHRFFHGEFLDDRRVSHTDDRVRRTLCRQHILLSAVTMTITVLENYKLCGGISAVRLSPDFLVTRAGKSDFQTLASDVLVFENSPY